MGFLYRILGLCLIVAMVTAHADKSSKKKKVYKPKVKVYKKDTLTCYQCAWSPGRTVYKTVTYYDEEKVYVPRHNDGYGNQGYGNDGYNDGYDAKNSYDGYGGDYVTKQIKKTKQVPVERQGGWGPCKGPFSRYQAKSFGIKTDKCDKNCFSRVDANGNIYRGCYNGEWGVDPSKLGCHKQAGSLYCFCNKDNCNNQVVPEYEKAH